MGSPELPIHYVAVAGTYDGFLEGPHATSPATPFGGYFLVRNGDGPFRGLVVDKVGPAYVEGNFHPDHIGFDKMYQNEQNTVVRYSLEREEEAAGQLYTGQYKLFFIGDEERERVAQMRVNLISTDGGRLFHDSLFKRLHDELERRRSIHLPRRELYRPL